MYNTTIKEVNRATTIHTVGLFSMYLEMRAAKTNGIISIQDIRQAKEDYMRDIATPVNTANIQEAEVVS